MTKDKTQQRLNEINQQFDEWNQEIALREMKLKPIFSFNQDDFDPIIDLLNEPSDIDLTKN